MDAKAFAANPARVLSGQAKPYSILIPPPNVTARLHLGHALNNTLQDVLIRAHRMMGYEAMWMPGTDHAGIATQAVVERRLKEEEGKFRRDFTREAFVARVQAWKDDYERQITDQLKLMGCSCDFDRQRFTMDEICARAVREAFFRLFRDGLIYRGKRLVNWDPALQTAVADDECFDEEVQTSFWYLKYPLVYSPSQREGAGGRAHDEPKPSVSSSPTKPSPNPFPLGGGYEPVTWADLAARGYPGANEHDPKEHAWVTVATTRPETYLADTAVALNPHDPRLPALRGLCVRLPIVGRVIPIIDDAYVVLPESMARSEEEKNDPKAKFATGFLKVTPGHDENDYQVYLRHKDVIDAAVRNAGGGLLNMMSPDWRVSDKDGWFDVGEAGIFVGLTMAEARKRIVAEFKGRGLLEAIKPYTQTQTFSDRSKAQVEPYLSDQWYVKVTDPRLAASANAALVAEQRSEQSPRRQPGGVDAADQERPTPSAGAEGSDRSGDGSMRFFPARYAKTFEHWHDNIRDWCISRQLWWGHRIPVWTLVAPAGLPKKMLQAAFQGLTPELTEDDHNYRRAYELAHALETQFPNDISVRHAREFDPIPGKEIPTASGLAVQPSPAQASLRLDVCLRTERDGIGSQLEAAGFVRDPDVLDTWFSSALWPLSTMGWPEPEQAATAGLLLAYNPTSVLCTAREIITLWVSRMTMFNRYFRSEAPGSGHQGPVGRQKSADQSPGAQSLVPSASPVPFKHVYIHAVVQDGEGQKMSKSLGNGVDPIDIIETHGSDAMRFTLCQIATQTQDVRLPVDILDPHTGESFPAKMIQHGSARVAAPIQEHKGKKMVSSFGVASGQAKPTADMPVAKNTSSRFDLGRNFANKMWNASRFTLAILDKAGGEAPAHADVPLADRWILSRLAATTREITEALGNYEFANYAQTLYRFVWDDFCDWYLEAIKPTVADDARQRATLAAALRGAISLAHPVMPFITEVIWEQVSARLGTLPARAEVAFAEPRKGGLLCTAGWPAPAPGIEDAATDAAFAQLKALVTVIREVRAQHQVVPKRRITLHVPAAHLAGWQPLATLIQTLAGVETIAGKPAEAAMPSAQPESGHVRFTFEGAEYAASNLADAVDPSAERARLAKLIAEKEKSIATMQARLANPGYAAKAPPAMVKQTQDQIAKDQADVETARQTLASLPA
jgi:valyl-tRNA synthetase